MKQTLYYALVRINGHKFFVQNKPDESYYAAEQRGISYLAGHEGVKGPRAQIEICRVVKVIKWNKFPTRQSGKDQ